MFNESYVGPAIVHWQQLGNQNVSVYKFVPSAFRAINRFCTNFCSHLDEYPFGNWQIFEQTVDLEKKKKIHSIFARKKIFKWSILYMTYAHVSVRTNCRVESTWFIINIQLPANTNFEDYTRDVELPDYMIWMICFISPKNFGSQLFQILQYKKRQQTGIVVS